MKQRLASRKCKSPQERSRRKEEAKGAAEENECRRLPTAFAVTRRRGRLERVDLSNTEAFFGRSARSNSPKTIDSSKHEDKRMNSPKTSRETNDSNESRKASRKLKAKVNNPSNEHTHNLERHNSPQPCKLGIEEPKELQRKKKLLNAALWEAAEKGDVIRIVRLLEPYAMQSSVSTIRKL
eukprot:TRINITY_DN5516_c0_g2_i1.p2 TRINITY_DN5516_c0_g2~~TRINITY_DN5516_c0_g2_i1.p2  ORF type:complete len:181 (-),score=45.21 TRINITY_DN5516_c0_g2_i1:35-577(-)